jgi:hypothetical protein
MRTAFSIIPIPFMPFSAWRWMFNKIGGKWWIKQSAENGVRKEDMYATPYADKTPLNARMLSTST